MKTNVIFQPYKMNNSRWMFLVFYIYSIILALLVVYLITFDLSQILTKAIIFSLITSTLFLVCLMSDMNKILYIIIFISIFNIPIVTLYTTSTNIIFAVILFVIFIKSVTNKSKQLNFSYIKNSPIIFYFTILLATYTISLLFIKAGIAFHIMFYHGLITAILISVIIIGTVSDINQIENINKTILIILILNLIFSVFYFFFPEIDDYRSKFLSLPIEVSADKTRLQGLSFRGEAYGEFLMACGIYLVSRIVSNKGKTNLFLIIITALTILALILTKLRGANTAFIFGIFFIMINMKTANKLKKYVSVILLCFIYVLLMFSVEIVSPKYSLLKRFNIFFDNTEYVNVIPATRYYTWIPGINYAKMNKFLGTGPSLKPYIENTTIKDVKIEGGSGNIIVWPHNVLILILCTVGIYGLLVYFALFLKIFTYKKYFRYLKKSHQTVFDGYFYVLFVLILEYQKYDGVLRSPNSNFYLIFIIIGIIFSSFNFLIDNYVYTLE